MIWTLLALFAVIEVVFGLYLWRKNTARAELLEATAPEQAAAIRRTALYLAFAFLSSPFLLAIVGWLAVGPPDFTW
jgi:hypothetical protein